MNYVRNISKDLSPVPQIETIEILSDTDSPSMGSLSVGRDKSPVERVEFLFNPLSDEGFVIIEYENDNLLDPLADEKSADSSTNTNKDRQCLVSSKPSSAPSRPALPEAVDSCSLRNSERSVSGGRDPIITNNDSSTVSKQRSKDTEKARALELLRQMDMELKAKRSRTRRQPRKKSAAECRSNGYKKGNKNGSSAVKETSSKVIGVSASKEDENKRAKRKHDDSNGTEPSNLRMPSECSNENSMLVQHNQLGDVLYTANLSELLMKELAQKMLQKMEERKRAIEELKKKKEAEAALARQLVREIMKPRGQPIHPSMPKGINAPRTAMGGLLNRQGKVMNAKQRRAAESALARQLIQQMSKGVSLEQTIQSFALHHSVDPSLPASRLGGGAPVGIGGVHLGTIADKTAPVQPTVEAEPARLMHVVSNRPSQDQPLPIQSAIPSSVPHINPPLPPSGIDKMFVSDLIIRSEQITELPRRDSFHSPQVHSSYIIPLCDYDQEREQRRVAGSLLASQYIDEMSSRDWSNSINRSAWCSSELPLYSASREAFYRGSEDELFVNQFTRGEQRAHLPNECSWQSVHSHHAPVIPSYPVPHDNNGQTKVGQRDAASLSALRNTHQAASRYPASGSALHSTVHPPQSICHVNGNEIAEMDEMYVDDLILRSSRGQNEYPLCIPLHGYDPGSMPVVEELTSDQHAESALTQQHIHQMVSNDRYPVLRSSLLSSVHPSHLVPPLPVLDINETVDLMIPESRNDHRPPENRL